MRTFLKALSSGEANGPVRTLSGVTIAMAFLMGVFAMGTAFMVREAIVGTFDNLYESRELQLKVNSITSNVVDAETSYRGYLISRDNSFLEPFYKAQKEIPPLLQSIHDIMRHGNELGPEFQTYEKSALNALAVTQKSVERSLQSADIDSVILPDIHAVKIRIDDLRSKTAALQANISRQLTERRGGVDHASVMLVFAVAVLIFGLAVIVAAQSREMILQSIRFKRSEREASETIAGLSDTVRTGQVEQKALHDKLDLALRSARVQVFGVQTDGQVCWLSDEASPVLGLRTLPFNLLEITKEQDRDALYSALNDKTHNDVSIKVKDSLGKDRFYKLNFVANTSLGDGLLLGSAVDVSELKAREETSFWLMRELSHRSKNLLAIVQSIARQTANVTSSVSAFQQRFTERLAGLAAAHDLLVKTSYSGADLRSLILSQLGARASYVGGRIKINGPELIVRHEAAQNIAMAFQELASNASIHGALSSSEGVVDLTWHIAESKGEPALIMVWREIGGPAPKAGNKAGFGTSLITKNLPRSLDGDVRLTHEPEGTVCEIVLPMRRLDVDITVPQPVLS